MTVGNQNISFAKNLAKSNKLSVYLLHGNDDKKGASWFYLEVDKKKEIQLKQAIDKGDGFSVADYGRIVSSGWGENPPEKTVNFLKELGVID